MSFQAVIMKIIKINGLFIDWQYLLLTGRASFFTSVVIKYYNIEPSAETEQSVVLGVLWRQLINVAIFKDNADTVVCCVDSKCLLHMC